jgi:protoporphyrinogen oxidase
MLIGCEIGEWKSKLMGPKTAIIIGAGPAGLTAAYELVTRTDIRPIVLESSHVVGGISRTVNFKGNRIDIGGHRFFSKSDRVMQWWARMMPTEESKPNEVQTTHHIRHDGTFADSSRCNPSTRDSVMLIRKRKSRIYFLRKFFDYPISPSAQTLKNLGVVRVARVLLSYLKSRLFPIRSEVNLEHFFINRFGNELYQTFFKSYTEKVWGVPCQEIPATWGAQRVKGLSISKTIKHVFERMARNDDTIAQKSTETTLIERFLYPKYGPGQMWETCARSVEEMAGKVLLKQHVHRILMERGCVIGVVAKDQDTGKDTTYRADYVFSTMPVKDLMRAFDGEAPVNVREVGEGLVYRDFITVGLLLKDIRIKENGDCGSKLLSDNWIYVQEPDVKVGRIQLFNNWSPYLVADPNTVWLGTEYFCNEGDALWELSDQDMQRLAVQELTILGFIDEKNLLDATVIRMPKTYPAYFGSFDRFGEIQGFVDSIPNLFLIGRNGMHKYNNQDHSMLTAMTAVDNIIAGCIDKNNIWEVNVEQDYHEDTSESTGRHAEVKDI